MKTKDDITFHSLEREDSDMEFGHSSLDDWYRSVRDAPLQDLTDGDLCRSIRQQLFVIHTVPIAIERLLENPSAGDLYDGELILAFKAVPVEYWELHPDDA